MSKINKNAKPVSISLNGDERAWLEDNNLSPSDICKQKIFEMMQINLPIKKKIAEQENTIGLLQKRVALLYEFIEQQKLFEIFAKFEEDKNVLEQEKGNN